MLYSRVVSITYNTLYPKAYIESSSRAWHRAQVQDCCVGFSCCLLLLKNCQHQVTQTGHTLHTTHIRHTLTQQEERGANKSGSACQILRQRLRKLGQTGCCRSVVAAASSGWRLDFRAQRLFNSVLARSVCETHINENKKQKTKKAARFVVVVARSLCRVQYFKLSANRR